MQHVIVTGTLSFLFPSVLLQFEIHPTHSIEITIIKSTKAKNYCLSSAVTYPKFSVTFDTVSHSLLGLDSWVLVSSWFFQGLCWRLPVPFLK